MLVSLIESNKSYLLFVETLGFMYQSLLMTDGVDGAIEFVFVNQSSSVFLVA